MRRNMEKCPANKAAGIVLIVVGVVILLFCVPEWLWTWLIGITLIAAGFLCWKIR